MKGTGGKITARIVGVSGKNGEKSTMYPTNFFKMTDIPK